LGRDTTKDSWNWSSVGQGMSELAGQLFLGVHPTLGLSQRLNFIYSPGGLCVW
jgi:hypothetical protein